MLFALDTEFSEFKGELISIALAGKSSEFYAVRHLPETMHPWVRENVVPILGKEPEDDITIKRRLSQFLLDRPGIEIVADWPEDFSHFMNLLCEPEGMRWPSGDIRMRLVHGLRAKPVIPHNALSDARALLKAETFRQEMLLRDQLGHGCGVQN